MESKTNDQLSNFWQLSINDAFKLLETQATGIGTAEAIKRLKQYGANTLKKANKFNSLIILFSQFKSPVTLLLIAAALLSAALGDTADTLIIMIIVLISSLLGFWQEKGAASAVSELLKMVQLHCTVLRDNRKTELEVTAVVPGDVICLSAGDIIPADGLVLESEALFVDEAAFTGESYPVEKNPGVESVDAPLARRNNCLFMGSSVVSGIGKALIVTTGQQTEFGKISDKLSLRIPETDFEKGIRKFGYMLMEITLLLVLVIFAVNVLLHKPALDSFLFSLALAVGLTPQLLPAIISVNLSVGARRMASQKVIVKRLSAIENFGSMNILCSDKTGTITEGKVTLKETLDFEGVHSDKVFKYAWLNASCQQGFVNPIDKAICSAHYEGNEAKDFSAITEVPYDFVRKRLTVQVKIPAANIAITKGAVRQVLDICNRVEISAGILADIGDHKEAILAQYQLLSDSGLRTLGVSYKEVGPDQIFTRENEYDMVFLGFITLFDPPRAGMSETIQKLQHLGVRLKIITGDNAPVARNLAKQLGLSSAQVLTGQEIRNMSSAALRHKAPLTHIFAEVEPSQKERIISVLKKAGNVVGFMGDGINDAPALHTADVGISVNSAVDVAKEAADIVLLDQDLNVLCDGIIEGRKTFTNTMKYIFMATSANFGNMFSMAGASLFLPFLPLLPKQILLTNLLTDFPEMTISSDKVDDINLKTPQRWNLGFIKRFMIVFGLLSSVFDYLTFAVLIFILHANQRVFQTGWFTESVVSAVLIVLVVRTRLSFFKSLPGKYLSITTIAILLLVLMIPYSPLASIFGFVTLSWKYYMLMLATVTAYILSAELAKRWFYKKIK
ncbi:magnesium-translocating P-type ATPase [Mucilaginibacter gossypii]|uniref:magnesium-translocating P-type ATPase n=1 Tax=Mucilaginibacter gossypii TaxID=551996 RepID=UPI000DCD4CCB|nr:MULTISPECIES: magnesium-translocating P-type ATPase [Mucilaginibacter]QTE38871.1 magnesium-translocating P-type ATPase [Mucilaginibacter gossypii]RAV55054.1 magnesium-translocating P-type ATPase [Mucilaginibacter rubeus]